jgi:hypothetical protein
MIGDGQHDVARGLFRANKIHDIWLLNRQCSSSFVSLWANNGDRGRWNLRPARETWLAFAYDRCSSFSNFRKTCGLFCGERRRRRGFGFIYDYGTSFPFVPDEVKPSLKSTLGCALSVNHVTCSCTIVGRIRLVVYSR